MQNLRNVAAFKQRSLEKNDLFWKKYVQLLYLTP